MTISRNAPCPCGSGKKYKQCCGKGAMPGVNLVSLLQQAWALHQAGRLPQAVALYRQILAAQPAHPDALHLLGLIVQQNGQLDEAQMLIEKAVRAKPVEPIFRHNLASVLYARSNFVAAEKQALEALRLQPGMMEAKQTLATVYKQQGRLKEAIRLFQDILARHPDNVNVLHNLGVALQEDNQLEAALPPLRHLLEILPAMVESRFAYGSALKGLGLFGEAEACFADVLARQPGHEGALQNQADLLQLKGELVQADSVYRQLLQHWPDAATGHLGLATCLLAQGNLEQGWQEYEWRMKRVFPGGFTKKRPFPQPWWQGEPLQQQRLLIWGEQGVGDEILFASLFGDAIASGATVTLECEPRLLALFARSFPAATVLPRLGEPYDPSVPALLERSYDYQIPAGGLARWLRPSLAQFPERCGFLIPDPQRVRHWQDWLATLGKGLRVGIAWRSMLRGGVRNTFYSELAQWGEILRTPGVVFVNLQYGECGEELAEARRLFGVEIHEAPGLNLKDDLDEAAALTRAMDRVIAPNTSVFAMAGAVGTPTWMLNLDCDWTMLGTDHIPWLPGVEVFRKPWGVPWEPVLSEVGRRLAQRNPP